MAYSVRLSGTVLSSLLYECANSKIDIEGFLLGVLSYKTTLTNDDSSEQAYERREDFIIIHGYQILKEKPYDNQGNINKTLVQAQQKDLTSIVGYFKFRRQTDVSLSVRDQLWMQSYSRNIPHGCIAIISSTLSNGLTDKSTHSYEFAFWDMKSADTRLPIDITNMTESTLGYKNFMSNTPYKLSEESSNFALATISPSSLIIKQYDSMYQQSIQALRAATHRFSLKRAEFHG
ncbi:hypothetical protein HMPREF1544_12027 [Mucor circinelloides 1006PhL]|uniref:JAB1/MPN/MOV34 metalloenzyme domain-containing protein n=1 Tax=Mucor circinelloides f. circinelloides (strain 1006PhL) TaxID=1220926 RepID=S2IUC5_MUCC1|nr:hypothetical protein HMPREF1544_12027 [Mucor circinelloides 1006PhL]